MHLPTFITINKQQNSELHHTPIDLNKIKTINKNKTLIKAKPADTIKSNKPKMWLIFFVFILSIIFLISGLAFYLYTIWFL